jgi:hypothetical protein
LLAHGTSAACLLTLQSYIFKHENSIIYSSDENGYVQLKESMGKEMEGGLLQKNARPTMIKKSSFTPSGLSISTADERLQTELFWDRTSEVLLMWLNAHLDVDVRVFIKSSVRRRFQIT